MGAKQPQYPPPGQQQTSGTSAPALPAKRMIGEDRIEQLQAELAKTLDTLDRYKKALEWIAHFDSDYLRNCSTIHHDMNGVAKVALSAKP